MVRIARFALTFFALSLMASAQQYPLAWFPLQPGTRWVYAHESKSGDRNRPTIDRWTTEETITGWVTIPEGTVVLREVKEQNNAPAQPGTALTIATNGQLRQVPQQSTNHSAYLFREREPYLVHGNCIYAMGTGWESKTQQLLPQFRLYLSDGSWSPDFCFPLQPGSAWGNNDIPWRVEPARADVGSLPPTEYADAIHIFCSHAGSGGSEDIWFQKGLGVVVAHYIHNGTYDEYTKKLLSFAP